MWESSAHFCQRRQFCRENERTAHQFAQRVRANGLSVCSEHIDEIMDCLKLNIRTSFTHNIATELERLFIDIPDTTSIWEEFSSNGQEHDLDEIDEVCIRGRQSQSVESDRSPPRSESGGSSPTTLPSTTTIPMSRARLLEILRMSERGRLKPKQAVTRPKPEVQVSLTLCPSGQVCLLSNSNRNEVSLDACTP